MENTVYTKAPRPYYYAIAAFILLATLDGAVLQGHDLVRATLFTMYLLVMDTLLVLYRSRMERGFWILNLIVINTPLLLFASWWLIEGRHG